MQPSKRLPNEILCTIFGYLGLLTLFECIRPTCRWLYHATHSLALRSLINASPLDLRFCVSLVLTSDIGDDYPLTYIYRSSVRSSIERKTSTVRKKEADQETALSASERLIYYDKLTFGPGDIRAAARERVRCYIALSDDCDIEAGSICTLRIPSHDGSTGDETFYQDPCGQWLIGWGIQPGHGLGGGYHMVKIEHVAIAARHLLRYTLERERREHLGSHKSMMSLIRAAQMCIGCGKNQMARDCVGEMCKGCCWEGEVACNRHRKRHV